MKKTYSIVGTEFANAETFVASLKPGVALTLVREPANKFDKNAVAVYCGEKKIGYLPSKQNAGIAMAMDAMPAPAVSAGASGMAPDTQAAIAADAVKRMPGIFKLSPNSAFPQVEVDE